MAAAIRSTRSRTEVQPSVVGSTGRVSKSSDWLTVDEACEIARISRRTFERHLARGTGPRVKRMRKYRGAIRIRREWLDEWMDEGAA